MDKHGDIITKSARETQEFGAKLAADLIKNRRVATSGIPLILCLYGDLGSGKTTFTRGFAESLGIPARLLSPSFIIVRRYNIPSSKGHFYHTDLYRIHGVHYVEQFGFSELFSESYSVHIIEWADRFGKELPKHRYDIHFSGELGNTRTISLEAYE